jgi:hypothetical protein
VTETKRCARCGGAKIGRCIDLEDAPTGELFCVRCGMVWPVCERIFEQVEEEKACRQ